MKRKTNIILVLLIVITVILMTGCKKTIEEKVTEKIIEGTTGADVDLDKDSTTIKTDQGTTQMGSNIKWPKDKVGNLKELKANITMFTEDTANTITYITFDGLKQDDANKYVESIKELGYKSLFETTNADGFVFSGNDEDGSEVVFSFYNDGTGSLSYSEEKLMFNESPDDSDSSDNSLFTGDTITEEVDIAEEVDMTDDVPWPSDFFIGIPELEGKITGVSSSGETEKYVNIEYVEKEDAMEYFNKIKEAGYTEGATESISGDYIDYQASNSVGDYIIFNWNSGNYSSLTLVKVE